MRPRAPKSGRSGRLGRGIAIAALAALCGGAPGIAPAAPAPAAPGGLPATTRVQLKNGLTVVVLPSRRLPLVDLRLVIPAGAVTDPPGREGLAGLTADLLTQGAGGRDARQVAEAIDFVGGTLNAWASTEQMVLQGEVLKKDFAVGLELLRDAVVSPALSADEFGRKKQEALGTIAVAGDDPGAVADRALRPFVMGDSPLGHPALGWASSVDAIDRDDVVAFHDANVRPDRAILAVVGDVDPKTAIKAVEEAFKGWKASKQKAAPPVAPLTRGAGRRVRIVDKPDVTQTQIRMACPAVARNHPDYYAITVANVILGSGFTSRLVDEVRINRGLTYDIQSRFDMYRNTGTFEISTFTRNETIREAVDATLDVVRRLQKEGPDDAELEKARRFITGLFPLGLQAPDALAARIADIEFYALEPDYVARFAERIDAVTMDDVRRALSAYFCVEDLNVLVVSDPAVARPALERLGPLDVVEVR